VLHGAQRAYEDMAGQEGFEVYEAEGEGGFVEDLLLCGLAFWLQRLGRVDVGTGCRGGYGL
jgi:hypothetical protein